MVAAATVACISKKDNLRTKEAKECDARGNKGKFGTGWDCRLELSNLDQA